MIRRPPRSTQSRSSAASDVYKRQIEGDTRRSHRGIRHLLCRTALFERAPRDEPGGRKLDVATLIVPRLVGLRLHLLEVRLGISHALLGDGRIDLGEELPLLDLSLIHISEPTRLGMI